MKPFAKPIPVPPDEGFINLGTYTPAPVSWDSAYIPASEVLAIAQCLIEMPKKHTKVAAETGISLERVIRILRSYNCFSPVGDNTLWKFAGEWPPPRGDWKSIVPDSLTS